MYVNYKYLYVWVLCSYIPVDSLAQQWQKMGVDPPHNQSLENVLVEVSSFFSRIFFQVCILLQLLSTLLYELNFLRTHTHTYLQN